jgi:hypothetical protein
VEIVVALNTQLDKKLELDFLLKQDRTITQADRKIFRQHNKVER